MGNFRSLSKAGKRLFIILTLSIYSYSAFAADAEVEEEKKPARIELPSVAYGGSGKKYQIYVEQMAGETWDEKIRNAVNTAGDGGNGAEIILPPTHISIKETIKLWKQKKTAKVNTRCEGVRMRNMLEVWASMKGATKNDILRGITLRGSPGVTTLKWEGGEDQVVIDMPAPWHITIKGFDIDGNNTKGLIGIRYRAGWEFGVNGGKRNLFEDIDIKRADVGFDIGGPFAPDLVGSTFNRIGVNACRIGFHFVGGNVAEQWVQNSMAGSCWEATFKLTGFQGRVVRPIADKNKPVPEGVRVFKHQDGYEIFLEQIPKRCFKKHVRRKMHPDVPGSVDYHWVGGGAPTTFISNLVSHNSFANAWVIESNWSVVRVQHIRCEGAAGILNVTGKGKPNVRFSDMLIDVNATTSGNSSGYAIKYEKSGPIFFVGGVFEGKIGLGSNTVCHAVGTRFNHRGRKMNSYLHEGATVPKDSFIQPNGKKLLLPHRRKPGISLTSGVHKEIGFVQLPGTQGMRVHQMQQQEAMFVDVPAGAKTVKVSLSGVAKQASTHYRVAATPNWRAGSVWVSKKETGLFEISFDEPAPAGGGKFDIIITRAGHIGELKLSEGE
ncbi:MAG: hypothetical protein ACYTFY_16075 [Planctomycetota bacterium]|jgi:hypothetical protein